MHRANPELHRDALMYNRYGKICAKFDENFVQLCDIFLLPTQYLLPKLYHKDSLRNH